MSNPAYLGTCHPCAWEYNRLMNERSRVLYEEAMLKEELKKDRQKALAIKLAEIQALQEEAEKIKAEIEEEKGGKLKKEE